MATFYLGILDRFLHCLLNKVPIIPKKIQNLLTHYIVQNEHFDEEKIYHRTYIGVLLSWSVVKWDV